MDDTIHFFAYEDGNFESLFMILKIFAKPSMLKINFSTSFAEISSDVRGFVIYIYIKLTVHQR